METKVAPSLVIIFLQPLSWNTSTRRRAVFFLGGKAPRHARFSVEVWTRVTHIASVSVANLTTVNSVSMGEMEETQSRPVRNSEVRVSKSSAVTGR